MAELVHLRAPVARSAFHGLALPGRHGRRDGAPGLFVRERIGLGLATLIARKGRGDALAEAVRTTFGFALPDRPRRASAGPFAALWAGPGQWMLTAEPGAAQGFAARVAEAAAGLALAADQSDGRGVLELSGPKVRHVLAKGVPVDLHPRAFAVGDTALTLCSHIDVQLWQADDLPTYGLALFRGFAGSFWHWLEESAAEYGIAVHEPA